MKVFSLRDEKNIQELNAPFQNYRILPDDSLVLTDVVAEHKSLQQITTELRQVITQISTHASYVFLDTSADPVYFPSQDLDLMCDIVKNHYTSSKCFMLTGNCEYYFGTNQNVFWYPYWLLSQQSDAAPILRQKRIGCLNRKNSPHRVWLMYNLLDQNLISHEIDIFSVSFNNIYSKNPCNIRSWMPDLPAEIVKKIRNYPYEIATFDDGFPNDHSLSNPAWATAIAVITETQVGQHALITEKTCKAFASKSCGILYTGQTSLDVLTDLQFDIATFEKHATGFDINPIIKVCRDFDTESRATEYYHSKIEIINHNHDWFRSSSWMPFYKIKLLTWLA